MTQDIGTPGLLDAVKGSRDYAYRTCPHRKDTGTTCRDCVARAAVLAVAYWLEFAWDEPARLLRAEVAPPDPRVAIVTAWMEGATTGTAEGDAAELLGILDKATP